MAIGTGFYVFVQIEFTDRRKLKKISKEDDVDTPKRAVHIGFDLTKISIELREDQGIHHTDFINNEILSFRP